MGMTTPVTPDQLRITVEMGDGYQPSDRLAAALTELTAALAEADEAEVSGYLVGDDMGLLFAKPGSFRSIHFDSVAGDFRVEQASVGKVKTVKA